MKKSTTWITLSVSLAVMTALYQNCAGNFTPVGIKATNAAASVEVESPAAIASKGMFDRRCVSCHAPGVIPPYEIKDTQKMIDQGLIVPGQPNQSKMYIRVANGSMPPSGGVTSQETDTLRTWIAELGADPTPTATPTATPGGNPNPTATPIRNPSPTPTPTTSPSPTMPPLNGASLYATHCASCHGQLANSERRGATVTAIQNAIDRNRGGMGRLSNLTPAQIQAISDALK